VELQSLLKKSSLRAFLLLLAPSLGASLTDALLLAGLRFFIEIVVGNPILSIKEWFFLMFLLIILRFIFLRSKSTLAQKLFRQLEATLQGYFVAVLRRLNPQYFHHPKSESKFQTAYNATQTLALSSEALVQVFQAFLQLLVFVPVLLYLSWQLTLFLFFIVLPILSFTQKKWRGLGAILNEQLKSDGNLRSELSVLTSLYRYWSSPFEKQVQRSCFLRLIRERKKIASKAGIKQATLSIFIESTSVLAMLLVLAFCAYMISMSWMQAQDLILYSSAIFLSYKPTKECIRIIPQMRLAQSAYQILLEISKEPRRYSNHPSKGSKLKIEAASFSYKNNSKQVFQDLSLSLDTQNPILITGPNGIGKTTLLRLLANLEAWDSGQIVYPESYKISGVFFIAQNIVLPPLSILKLLIQKQSSPSLENFMKLAKVQHLFEKKEVSGGEKARLALVWALASKSNILLLDEPFAYISRFDKNHLLVAFLEASQELNKWIILSSHEVLEAPILNRFKEVSFYERDV